MSKQTTYHLNKTNTQLLDQLVGKIDPLINKKCRVLEMAVTIGLAHLMEQYGTNQKGNQESQEEALSQTVQETEQEGE